MAEKKKIENSEKPKRGRKPKALVDEISAEINEVDDVKEGKEYTVKVETFLNVRSGAGKQYGKIGSLNNGDKVVILEEKNGFGRIADGKWIMMKYLH